MELIRPVQVSDAARLATILNHYILNTTNTFALEPLSEKEMEDKLVELAAAYPFLVAEREGHLVGYAHFNQYRSRCAYNHVAETSIYVAPEFVGQGIGTRLYPKLLEQARNTGISEVIAVVALPNEASERLHRAVGFKRVGVFTRMGYKLERWVDTSYWQLSLASHT